VYVCACVFSGQQPFSIRGIVKKGLGRCARPVCARISVNWGRRTKALVATELKHDVSLAHDGLFQPTLGPRSFTCFRFGVLIVREADELTAHLDNKYKYAYTIHTWMRPYFLTANAF